MTDFDFDPNRLPAKGFQVPDLAEAVEGWRVWTVARELPPFGQAPKLRSVTNGNRVSPFWTPRRAATAVCPKHPDEPDHEVPQEACTCGFYSAKTYDHLKSQSYHKITGATNLKVIGQVANWGKVIEGSQGWRAEKCYPVKLWVPFQAQHLAKPLANAYGVPVQVLNFQRRGTRPNPFIDQ